MSGLAEEELERSEASRWARIAGGTLLLVAGVGLLAFLLKSLVGNEPVRQKPVTRITVLPDKAPPPPPPPPPKEEIRPPKEVKEVRIEQPKPVEQPRPAEQIKMEGPAGDGPSPFAAGEVTRDYIGGPVGIGSGSGAKLQFAFFSKALQRHIQDELERNRKVKIGDYRVSVKLWIEPDGTVRRAELVDSSGSAETDRALRAALGELGRVRTPIPESLPQPITLRITNRMIG